MTTGNEELLSIVEQWINGKVKRERKPKVKKIKQKSKTVMDEREVIDKVLRDFFIINGKHVPKNPSVRAMQQFLRFTDGISAGKNVEGGSLFTNNNRDKSENQEVYGSVYANVLRIKQPIWYIKTILEENKRLDMQHLERISYRLMDLVEVMPGAVRRLKDDPAIKDNDSKFMRNVGHNVGFRDFILEQFSSDIENHTYEMLIGMVNAVIYKTNL